ncbi:TVP38/TMEM64 family protein [Pannus brasiliensis CCIBt3594]|uniref:TVP38/TMEM64 family membrane protein n=1 Tax=Pannus brasiliensis CCIBt3594 TaxID=1427578 RepID=A0AAW9QSW7_9CHRO
MSSRENIEPGKNLRARTLQRIGRLSIFALILPVTLLIWRVSPAFGQETSPTFGLNPRAWLQSALESIDRLGAVGAIAFIALYIVATIAFVPGSPLTLGAGAIFGILMGSLYVLIGATLGAIAAFLVGRYLAREWVARKIAGNQKFAAIDRAVGREGLKIVLLTRLSPVFPFIFLNYAYGVTAVSLRDYALGSVGMIPGTILYVYIGSLAGNLASIGTGTPSANPALQWSVRIVGLIATIAVTLYTTKIARTALEKEVSASPDPESDRAGSN